MRYHRPLWLVVLVLTILENRGPTSAADWHVAVRGTKSGQGSVWSPWDLASVLAGQHKIAPGDTVWLAGGTYRHPDRSLHSAGYVVQMAGQPNRPIRIRGRIGQRVTIDGGLAIQPPSTHLRIQDLEIIVSENSTMSREVQEPGSHPESYGRPWGGLNIHAGTKCLYLNLVIHDNAQGISFWSGATDSEVNGCIIYDNGWTAPDRGHGHAIYTQNQTGIKTIRDCIMTGGYSYTMHAYGSSRAHVDHYLAEGNICYDAGTFLMGGEGASRDIRVLKNYLFNVPMQIGYSAPDNEDCEIRDNIIANGALRILQFRRSVNAGNLVLHKNSPRPNGEPARVVMLPNRYDPQRCHVAVFNWSRQPTVDIPADAVLSKGDKYRLLNPRNFYGEPLLQGVFNGEPLRANVPGEFAAFVLLNIR